MRSEIKERKNMKIINYPEMTVDDLITVGAYYEANKKKFKQQKLAKDCYEFINKFIDNQIKGKAELQPKIGLFYKNLDYQHNINFINASSEDKQKFIDWINKFTSNRVKLINRNNKKFCKYSDNNLRIIYK